MITTGMIIRDAIRVILLMGIFFGVYSEAGEAHRYICGMIEEMR